MEEDGTITVQVKWGAQEQSADFEIGMDDDGCHVVGTSKDFVFLPSV